MTFFILLEDGDQLLQEDGGGLLLEAGITISQSKSIDFNNGIITQAKLTSTHSGAGDVTFYMSADGTNFESITNGNIHIFSNTGTDLRWKAEGSEIVITKIKIEDYH